MLRIPSPDEGAFEVLVPEAAPDIARQDDTNEGEEQYRRLNDSSVKGAARTSAAEPHNAAVCEESRKVRVEVQSPLSVEQERVDYEVGDEDLLDNDPEESEKGEPSAAEVAPEDPEGTAQVQPSDPYDFD
jgi:hypothetical protein